MTQEIVAGDEDLQRQVSNELDEQAKKIENFILQMEKDIVGGGTGTAGELIDLTDSAGGPDQEDMLKHRLSFK